ncbi:MAG: DNA alkylation response protein [Actinobacteria bacterium]|nr:DNA alkylation response protein [Actinomycetota bacterium]
MGTHEVDNQPPPLLDHDAYAQNRPLVEAVRRFDAGWAEDRLSSMGRAATGQPLEWGRQANENPPVLRTHDRYGNRIDEVEFHPSWHELMRVSIENAIHALPWREKRAGAHVARGAMMIAISQSDSGVGCPISMTYASVPALRAQPEVATEWEPKLTSTEYDPRLLPLAEKRGAVCGMAMTEKQGGSDVRANTTTARAVDGGGPGTTYELTGHKWFCSAPMSDAFLVLAQAEGGLSCFLLPRVLEDGTRNTFRIQRLKNKLGNRSNASSEVEFEDSRATMIGEEGRGVPTIIEMVNHTRLDCVLGSTALMREAVAQATHHAAHRSAFGKLLLDQPLMQNVLADLCIESEAATITAMRLAHAFDRAADDDQEASFRRLATAVAKYWVCKTAVSHVGEALECLGGNGYVEDSGMPRLYKESPLNSIWEGSGNVNCLDVLRAMERSPAAVEAFFVEVESADDPRLERHTNDLKGLLAEGSELETRGRRVVEAMAVVLQASLLLRFGDRVIADAFLVTRLGGDHGRAYGTLPAGLDFKGIIERHRPQV